MALPLDDPPSLIWEISRNRPLSLRAVPMRGISEVKPGSAARDVSGGGDGIKLSNHWALKQILPHKAKEIELLRLVAGVLPEELKRGFENIELGGMSASRSRIFATAGRRPGSASVHDGGRQSPRGRWPGG